MSERWQQERRETTLRHTGDAQDRRESKPAFFLCSLTGVAALVSSSRCLLWWMAQRWANSPPPPFCSHLCMAHGSHMYMAALGCSLTTTILIEYTDAPHPPLDTSPRLLESYTHGSYSQQLDDHCLLKLHGMEFGGVDVGELRGLWNARREGSRRGIWEEWFRNVGGGIDGVFARGEEWGGRSVGMVWKNILGVLPAVVRDGARPNNMPYTRTRIAFDVVDECEIVGAVLSFGDAGWEVRWQGLSVTVVGNVKGTHEHAVRRAGHTVGVVKVERVFGVAEWVGNLNDGVEGLNECGATRDAGGGQVVVCGAAVWVVWAVAVVMGGGEDCAHLLEGGREVMDVEDGAVVVAPVEERRAGRAANDEVVPLQVRAPHTQENCGKRRCENGGENDRRSKRATCCNLLPLFSHSSAFFHTCVWCRLR